MNPNALRSALWGLFAVLLAIGGYLALAACDLGLQPLFGLRYCESHGQSLGARATENERRRALLARLQEAELRDAQTPLCPSQQEKPKPRADKSDLPPREDGPKQELKIPQRKEELEGCWQSARGDIHFYQEETGEFAGAARICFCFDKNGRGVVRQTYTEGPQAGAVCQTDLKAALKPDALVLEHPMIPCSKGNSTNSAGIRCAKEPDGGASCIARYKSLKKPQQDTPPEKFFHVPNEYCGWKPGR